MTGSFVLCDQPGCDRRATHIAQAEGKNTPPKVWRGCDDHAATPKPTTDEDGS